MPTLTKVTQTYQNESIECACLTFDEPGTYKFPHVVNAATDYEFQMVAKAAAAATVTIQCGDTTKTVAITTSFDRYVIAFPSVTNSNDSLYLSFPTGTYYLYNIQLERAKNPSGWRPAPEDATDYADSASQAAVDAQTQLDVFNKLTNNGQTQGLYLYNGKVYINADYLKAGTINANDVAITNLIADHLRSYENADTWQLDSVASQLKILQLVNSIWKMRTSVHLNNADGGTVIACDGDVDADGNFLGGAAHKTTMTAQFLRVGMDKDNNVTGSIYGGNYNGPTIRGLKTSSVLSSVNAYWQFSVAGCNFLLVKGYVGGNRTMVIRANASNETYRMDGASGEYITFKCVTSSNTMTITVQSISGGSTSLDSCYSII